MSPTDIFTHSTHKGDNMSDKTPFELRKDILDLSFKVVESQHNHYRQMMEIQRDLMENALDMLSDAEEDVRRQGKEQLEKTKETWDEVVEIMSKGKVPTLDQIMETAKKFQIFVNQKN